MYSKEVEIPTFELECECFIAHEHEEKTENHEDEEKTKELFNRLATEKFENIDKIHVDYCRYALQRILRIFNNHWIENCKYLV